MTISSNRKNCWNLLLNILCYITDLWVFQHSLSQSPAATLIVRGDWHHLLSDPCWSLILILWRLFNCICFTRHNIHTVPLVQRHSEAINSSFRLLRDTSTMVSSLVYCRGNGTSASRYDWTDRRRTDVSFALHHWQKRHYLVHHCFLLY